MRSVPTANGALIRDLLSTEGGRLANHCLAEIWVGQAITAGCDPFMQQEPLGSDGYARRVVAGPLSYRSCQSPVSGEAAGGASGRGLYRSGSPRAPHT